MLDLSWSGAFSPRSFLSPRGLRGCVNSGPPRPGSNGRSSGRTLIPGDGIGPEIVKSAVDILDALGSPFGWDVRQGGLAAIEESHDPLPHATLDSIRRTRLALKGPLTTPVGGGFRSI